MKHLPVSLQPLSDIGFPFNLFQQLEEFPDMWLWWILHHMDHHLLFSIFFFFLSLSSGWLKTAELLLHWVAALMWGFVVAWQAQELQTLELQAFLLMAQCRCCGLRKLRVFRSSLMWWHMWMQEWVCAASLPLDWRTWELFQGLWQPGPWLQLVYIFSCAPIHSFPRILAFTTIN